MVDCPACLKEYMYQGEEKLKCRNPQCGVLTFTVYDKKGELE